MVEKKEDLKNNKYKDVAARWGEPEDKVKEFLIAIERQNRMIPGRGGPRKMAIRDRTDHRTGYNIILNPDADKAAHELYLKQQARTVEK